MTKQELITLLTLIYNKIPPCRCGYIYREYKQTDPDCHRHALFTEAEINYICIALGNTAVIAKTHEKETAVPTCNLQPATRSKS